MRRVVPVVMGLLIAAAVLPLLPGGPAGAAPPAPVLVSPADGDPTPFRENPVFQWQEASTAVRYVVQVSASNTMTPLVSGGSITTTNLRATYTQDLPVGTLYWRVGAYDTPSGGTATWSQIRSFTKAPVDVPTLVSPADGATLTYPTTPPNLSWSAVAGAKSYEIVIDNDAGFNPPYTVSETTTNTTFTLENPQTIGQTFYWRVRARSNNNATGEWSQTRSYQFSWGVPTLVSPGAPEVNIPPNPLPIVEQVEFVWNPLAGAVRYDIQYDVDINFANPTTERVKSTRYSPPVTLGNDEYFWRVRGVTTTNGVGNWSEVYTFERAWPAGPDPAFRQTEVISPVAGSPVQNVPIFRWSPQRLASTYQLQFSKNSNFSGATTVTTTHTEYTPPGGLDIGVVYYWRVRGIDNPKPVNGVQSDVFGETGQMIYHPGSVPITGPNPGTYQTPKITWNPVTNIGRYRVRIYDKNLSLVHTEDTYQTSYFPQGLDPDPAKNPYRVTVVTLDNAGRPGPELITPTNPFTVAEPVIEGALPNPTGPANPASTRVPPLTWQRTSTDGTYRIYYRKVGDITITQLQDNLRSNAYAHTGSNVAPGEYEWFVRAYNKNGTLIGDGAWGTFTVVLQPDTVLSSPTNCPESTVCQMNYDTPVLEWEPVPEAQFYRVWLSNDILWTSPIAQYTTQFPRWTFIDSLPDNQSGRAYYWYAQPCYGTGTTTNRQCGTDPDKFPGLPGPNPVRAFQKIAKPVPQLTPTPGQVVTTSQVTFTWTGFLQTNQSGAVADRVTQEARQYRVQVSDKADFSNLIDNTLVDQTTYTAFNKTYPEGQLWWRVIIVDGSGNTLTAPPPQTFTKTTPKVTLTSPNANQTVPGTPTLAWTPQNFTSEYEVEVYKITDPPSLSTGNRVFRILTEFPSATPLTPLAAGEYGWRVRRFDADGRANEWSAETANTLRRFTISGSGPTLLEPANQSTVDPNRIFFSWTKPAGAVSYKIETSTSSTFAGANTETVTTVMSSWAPRAEYTPGIYFWKVTTLDANGAAIGVSNTWRFSAGEAGDKYVSINPTRVLDSRGPTGGWNSKLGQNASRSLKVAGGSLPAPITASAVVLNVTAVSGSQDSFLTLYPTGAARPNTSNLNFVKGQIVPNLVTVKVGTNGNVNIFNAQGNVDVVADMVGYYEPVSGDRYNPVTPARILDSRYGPYWAGTNSAATIGGNATKDVQVGGVGGVPSDAKAAIVNITAVEGSLESYLLAWPSGAPKPTTGSNLNFVPGQVVPNLAIVKLGGNGRMSLYNAQGNVNVVVDVVGYFDDDSGSTFHALEPSRVLDSRYGNGLNGTWRRNQTRNLQVATRGGVPSGANAVVMNVTGVQPTASTYITLFPQGVTKPNASNLNVGAGQITPNLVTVGLSASGMVGIYNAEGNVDILADVVGYYADF